MVAGMKYRHELKYVVTAVQMALLESRIRNLISLDSHAGEEGSYRIRSLYFDDRYHSCYLENEIGTDPREKFRIRIYNGDPGRISLELKRKEHGMTQKIACPLTKEQCLELMAGSRFPQTHLMHRCAEVQSFDAYPGMGPAVIVEYDRVPYVDRLGNVRVTLDRNIASSQAVSAFLDLEISRRPVMPAGQHILEVKYDEFLPDYIYRNLQIPGLQQTAFSKYYLCRRFSQRGIL